MLTNRTGPAERAELLHPHWMRVLFLCTASSARSQMAEALLVRNAGDRAVVASAGSNPAAAVRPEAIEALNAAGIDLVRASACGRSPVRPATMRRPEHAATDRYYHATTEDHRCDTR